MTTDIIKFREVEKQAVKRLSMALASFTGGESVRSDFALQAPAGDAHALFEMLDQHKLDQDGMHRCMSAAVALLKHAHEMLDKADGVIAEQEEKIHRLETVSSSDELTGLKNRRGFFEAFSQDLDRCNRGLTKGGLLVLVDLDSFKAINDTYGHQAGDAALRLVARTLEAQIRIMDVAARLGGDEFVLLLSNTTKNDAAARAQDLAWQLNHLTLVWNGEEIPVRASIGLRSFKAGDGADKIFNDADIQLYANKRAGKKPTSRAEIAATEAAESYQKRKMMSV
jgi:diguanylate cyclase (GGDEF)-like protein